MARLILIFCLLSGQSWALPAFPGAQGFGSETQGGRSGLVCKVTTLADSGEGSLRACIEKQEPRIVVFGVGGVIQLESGLRLENPSISIFGQTAPGDGIMLTNAPGMEQETFTIRTHNVIIQHLRFRAAPGAPHALVIAGMQNQRDGRQTYNIMLDHCSLSGGDHSILAMLHDVHNLTISNSLIGPGSANSKGIHIDADGGHSISLHHNLIAHALIHSPGVKTGDGVVDIVNNLIYNWGENSTEIISKYGSMQVNLIHNLYIRGKNSTPDVPEIIARNEGKDYQLFLEENLSIREMDQIEPLPINPGLKGWLTSDWESDKRFPAPPITTFKSHILKEKIPMLAGANLPQRDNTDKAIIADIDKHQYGIPAKTGDWVFQNSENVMTDQDNDGISDIWEKANGLDPAVADAIQDKNINGYSNIEEWIFSLTTPES